jgi:hypothetical protein
MSERTTTWPDLAAELFEKLTGQGGEITYEFVNLEVAVPGGTSASAERTHWRLNGTLRIRPQETGRRPAAPG